MSACTRFKLLKQQTGFAHDRSRQPGKPPDLQTIAAIGRTGSDLVKEDDAALMLRRRQMQIECSRRGLGKLCQLEIVRGKQRHGTVVLQQPFGNRMRKRQTVEGRGAAPDFIHQHQ